MPVKSMHVKDLVTLFTHIECYHIMSGRTEWVVTVRGPNSLILQPFGQAKSSFPLNIVKKVTDYYYGYGRMHGTWGNATDGWNQVKIQHDEKWLDYRVGGRYDIEIILTDLLRTHEWLQEHANKIRAWYEEVRNAKEDYRINPPMYADISRF